MDTIKTIIIGNSGAGKTSLIARIVSDQFQHNSATIGVEFNMLSLPGLENRIRVWDLTGDMRFTEIISLYYRDCEACMIAVEAFDANPRSTFMKWYTKVLENSPCARVILVVTKMDDARVHPHQSSIRDTFLSFQEPFRTVFLSAKSMDEAELRQTLAPCFYGLEPDARGIYRGVDVRDVRAGRYSCCVQS